MLLIKVAERMDDDGKDRDHELEEFIVKMCNQRFMFREKIMTLILAHIKPLPSSAIALKLRAPYFYPDLFLADLAGHF